jgi:hypothetical protein|tara:strand:- start:272 stop:508 length:237 start_codon:yes stop_codon:yes gene_type:complete
MNVLEKLTVEQQAVLLHLLLQDWDMWEQSLSEWTKEDVVVEDQDTGEIKEPEDDDELVQRSILATSGIVRQFLKKNLS